MIVKNHHNTPSNLESISLYKSLGTIESSSIIKSFTSVNLFLEADLYL